MLRPVFVALVTAVLVAFLAAPASAQGAPQSDAALATCVADNTSGKDRKDLAKWIFIAMAAHPEIKSLAAGDLSAPAEGTSRTIADMITRLLTKDCLAEARVVVKAGQGTQAFKVAFEGLGKLAMQELMTDPAVQGSMGAAGRYLDQQQFAEAFKD
jgi:hypothetical protein